MARILLFGRDSNQLETRQWFLKKLYDSVPVFNVAELKAQAVQGSVDLLVLCETVSEDEVRAADAFLHENCPMAKILALHSGIESSEAVSGTLRGPSFLLQQVAEQLRAA